MSKREDMLKKLDEKKMEVEFEIEEAESELHNLKEKLGVIEDAIDDMENGETIDEDELSDLGIEDIRNIIPLHEDEIFAAETLLRNAKLTGAERSDLEEMLEDDDLDRSRYQEIVNSHLSILHAHQK